MSEAISNDISYEDFLNEDRRTISTIKVIFGMWKFRLDFSFVTKLAEILSNFVAEKRVFRDIEFYLPQLAHMIIHLNTDFNNAALESLAMLICQSSMHAGLQMIYILVAAMEDYQPENNDGQKNPNANNLLFFRCMRLLHNVERSIVFGSPTMTSSEEAILLEIQASISSTSHHPQHHGHHNIEASIKDNEIVKSGELFYKRNERKNIFYAKIWKPRFFVVADGVLLCYHDSKALKDKESPLRAIPLSEECEIRLMQGDSMKYDFEFEIFNASTNFSLHLRAKSQLDYDSWLDALQSEIMQPDKATSAESSSISFTPCAEGNVDGNGQAINSSAQILSRINSRRNLELSLTHSQKNKFHFIRQQRCFITCMTDICERLRFIEKDLRKQLLKKYLTELVVPPFAYLPLCSSLDTFGYILRASPREAHAFSTKARCPALMLFEVEEHSDKSVDMASFLSQDLCEYEESAIECPRAHVNNDISDIKGGNNNSNTGEREAVAQLPSRFQVLANSQNFVEIWEAEGSGIRNIKRKMADEKLHEHSFDEVSLGSFRSSNAASTSRLEENASNAVNASPSTTAGGGTGGGAMKPLLNEELFDVKAARIKAASPYGHLSGWKLDGLIAKSNDDVRQEVFIMQMISYFKKSFHAAGISPWLHTYRIMSTTKSTGLIELITNASSIDGLKKKAGFPGTLRKYYELTYGYVQSQGKGSGKSQGQGTEVQPVAFTEAINEFVKSMAGYSIVAYLLGIKDRHNGNIMIDSAGHVIHIDFGFVLGLAPGKAFSMEKAPYKLTEELVDVMGGPTSPAFDDFVKFCAEALISARQHADDICTLMEIMSYRSNYPAFKYNPNAIADFRSKLFLHLPDEKMLKVAKKLAMKSYKHSGTDFYDTFQVMTNGIAK